MPGKGSNRWAKAAHIKKGTQGSFNELSFSVLDSAKQAVESEQGEAPRKLLGVIPLFTLNSRGASSTASVPSKTLLQGSSDGADAASAASSAVKTPRHQRPADQSLMAQARKDASSLEPFEKRAVEKRSARLRRRVLVFFLVFVLAAGFLGYAGYVLYNNDQYQRSQIAIVDQALTQIIDADKTLTSLNDALSDPQGEGSRETLEKMVKSLPQTKITLQRAASLIERGSEGLQDNYSKEVASRAQKAVEARVTMAEQGLVLAQKITGAFDVAEGLESVWNLAIQADSSARAASSLLLQPTQENLEKALSGTKQALGELSQAQQKLASLGETPEVDLSGYRAYLEKRTEALSLACQAIESLMEEDLDAARSLQETYSKTDAEAASLASGLSSKPSEYVFMAYQENAQEIIDSYSQARTAAGFADSMLREYYANQRK